MLVVLTQAAEGSDSLAHQLTASGLEVERWPLVRLAPVGLPEIKPVLERLADYDWIFLPSPSAVRLVAQQMKQLGIAWPARSRAGLIGPASVEAFRDCFGDGPLVDTPAQPPHDTQHLVEMLGAGGGGGASGGGGGKAGSLATPIRALVLNRPDGRTQWIETLREKAESVTVVPAYTAEPLQDGPSADLIGRLQHLERDGDSLVWVVGASSQLDTLLHSLPADLARWSKRQPLLVPHVAIQQHAQACGFVKVLVYDDRRDLVERLQYLRHGHGRTTNDEARGRSGTHLVPPPGGAQTGAIEAALPAMPADKEEISVLSLDQQKPSAIPGARLTDDPVTDAKMVDTARSGAMTATPPSSSPAAGAAPTPTSDPTPTAGSIPSPSSLASSPALSSASSPTASPSPSASPAGSSSASLNAPSVSGPPARPPFSSPPPRVPEPPPPPAYQPAPSPPPPAQGGGAAKRGGLWALLVLLLVGALAAGGWWYTQQRFLAAERDGARRVQEAEARAAQFEAQIKSLRDSQTQLLQRSSTLEAKVAESASQQEQLATLYDEIAKSRGDSVLAEVEQAVMMAHQHLELTGNVQGALLALGNAEKRLGNSDQSQAIGIRRLILQDIERLKALPEVDLTRSAARLDEIINRVDRLPLLADANPASPPAATPQATPAAGPTQGSAPAAAPEAVPAPNAAPAPDAAPAAATAPAASADAAASGGASGPVDATGSTGATPPPGLPATAAAPAAPAEPKPSALERLYASVVQGGAKSLAAMRDEFRSLVTIRRIDRPDSLLLSPQQKQAARENLKLLLLNARLNLLSRHEDLFRQDLTRVVGLIERLYDTEQHDVKTAIETLESLQAQPLALNLPSLDESLAAVRAARAASEKRS